MRTALVHTVGVQAQIVCLYAKAQILGDLGLFTFDLGIAKFHDAITLQADKVVMVITPV